MRAPTFGALELCYMRWLLAGLPSVSSSPPG